MSAPAHQSSYLEIIRSIDKNRALIDALATDMRERVIVTREIVPPITRKPVGGGPRAQTGR